MSYTLYICIWLRLTIAPVTHWGRVMHICVSKLTIIGSDNDLSLKRRLAIIWTNAGILLIQTLEQTTVKSSAQFIYSFIQENAFENVVCKMSSISSRPQWVWWCPLYGLRVAKCIVNNHRFNSSPAYMCRWTGSALVHILTCRLFGAKPLPEPMVAHC